MFSSLMHDFQQPIAMFGSSGTTNADILGSLLLLSIINIEEAGGRVLGVACDGASTNKKMYAGIKIDGKMVQNAKKKRMKFTT